MNINENLQNARLREQQALKEFQDKQREIEQRLERGERLSYWENQDIRNRLKTQYQIANEERRKLERLDTRKQIQRAIQIKKQPIIKTQQTQQRTLSNDTIKKAQNILNKVSKSGSITPQERKFFINNRLDTKILSQSAISYNFLNKVSRGERVTFNELSSAGLTPNQATEILLKASEEKDVRDLGKLAKDIFNENLKEFNKKLEDPTIVVDSTTQRSAFKIQVNKELERLGEKKLPASASIKEYEKKLKERILPKTQAKETFKITNELINKIDNNTKYKVNKQIISNFIGKKNKQEKDYFKALSKVSRGQTLTKEDKRILNSNIVIKNNDKFGRDLATGFLFDAPKKSIILSYNFGKDLSNWAGKLGSFTGDKFGKELGELIRRVRDDKPKDTQTYLESRYFKTPIKIIFKEYVNGIKTQKQLIDSSIKLFEKNPKGTLNDLAVIMAGAVVIGGAIAINLKVKVTSKIADFIRKKGARGVGELIGYNLIELSDWYSPNKIKNIKNVSNLNKLFKLINIDSKDVKIINSIIKKSEGILKADDLKNITKIINRNTGLLLDVKNVKSLNKNNINLIKLLIKNKRTNNFQKFDFGVSTNFIIKNGKLVPQSTITGKGIQILKGNKEIPLEFVIRETKNGDLVGYYKLGNKDSFIKQKIELIDEGVYYLNKRTDEKIAKIKAPITDAQITLKTKKFIRNEPIKGRIRLNNIVGNTLEDTITRIYLGSNKALNKRFKETKKVTQEILDVNSRKQIKTIFNRILKETKKGKSKIQGLEKPLNKQDVKNIESFLKSIDYDKVIINGRDRRTRLARALGLRKDNKLLDAVEIGFDKFGKPNTYLTREIKIKSFGSIEKGSKPIIKGTRIKTKRVSLKKKKKGQLNLFQDNKIELLIKKNDKLIPQDKINIPGLNFKLDLTPNRLKYYGAIKLFNRIRDTTKLISSIKALNTLKDFKQLKDGVKSLKKDIKTLQRKINEKEKELIKKTKQPQIQKRAIVQKKKQSQKQRQRSKLKNILITKTTIKPKIKIPKISISKPKIKIPKIPPLPKLNFDSKKLDNKVLNAEAVFRERKYRNKLAGKNNPIITKKINIRDTKNRILKRVRDRVDNSLTASLELKIVGIGKKKKDINKPSLSKFRVKKSKNSAILKLVEANKNRFDTKGEVREAKRQKAKKRNIKKKVVKKKIKRKNKR